MKKCVDYRSWKRHCGNYRERCVPTLRRAGINILDISQTIV